MKTSIRSIYTSGMRGRLLVQMLLIAALGNVRPLSLHAQITAYCSGLNDNYGCPEEPVTPDPALLAAISAQYAQSPCFGALEFDNFPGKSKCDGTPIPQNAFFIHRLTFPAGNITGATLRFRAKAGPFPQTMPPFGQTHTDFIAFFEGATFITGAGLRQLAGAGGTWNANQDATFTLALGNLPAAFSVSNILPYLNDGDLDVLIGNETGVDWMCIYPATATTCCTDFNTFSNTVDNAVFLTTNPALLQATVGVGDLPVCDSIAWINWGDGQTDTGPYGAGSTITHTYAGNGNYPVALLALEKNTEVQPPQLCFEKIFTDTVSMVTSAVDAVFDKSYRLYPNPTTSALFIEWQNPLKNGVVQLVGSLSQTLSQFSIPENFTNLNVQVADLPQGIYFVKIISGERQMAILKFVKQ